MSDTELIVQAIKSLGFVVKLGFLCVLIVGTIRVFLLENILHEIKRLIRKVK